MDYSVGSRVRVKLYGGKIIEAKIPNSESVDWPQKSNFVRKRECGNQPRTDYRGSGFALGFRKQLFFSRSNSSSKMRSISSAILLSLFVSSTTSACSHSSLKRSLLFLSIKSLPA